MLLQLGAVTAGILATVNAYNNSASIRPPLSYAPEPASVYVPPKSNTTVTLLDLIKSRPELSTLLKVIGEPAGFAKAFDTEPTWSFTFFAPSNTAFVNTGAYYSSYAERPKGKWWLGNQLVYHYVPNSALNSSAFNSTATRVQSGNYLYISTQVTGGALVLNNASTITEADIPVTSGIIHIIDHVLDPSAQIFNVDLPKVSQSFIAGSCSNPDLPYC